MIWQQGRVHAILTLRGAFLQNASLVSIIDPMLMNLEPGS
jgi:hypothetical protein